MRFARAAVLLVSAICLLACASPVAPAAPTVAPSATPEPTPPPTDTPAPPPTATLAPTATPLPEPTPVPPQRSLHEAAFLGDVDAIRQHIAAGTELDTVAITPLGLAMFELDGIYTPRAFQTKGLHVVRCFRICQF